MSDVNNWLETYTGGQFFYDNMEANELRIVDIAHSLSGQPRYLHHTRRFYSIAEHCNTMCEYVYATMKDRITYKDIRTILLHDADETYFGDLNTVFKKKLRQSSPWFVAFETDLNQRLALTFDLHYPVPGWIKDLDKRIVKDERRQVMRPSPWTWAVDHMEPLNIDLPGETQRQAYEHFMKIFTFCTEGQMEQEEEDPDALQYSS